jgi:hypothetical protein
MSNLIYTFNINKNEYNIIDTSRFYNDGKWQSWQQIQPWQKPVVNPQQKTRDVVIRDVVIKDVVSRDINYSNTVQYFLTHVRDINEFNSNQEYKIATEYAEDIWKDKEWEKINTEILK